MTDLPREAREGLMRAWLDILRERHPGVEWAEAPREPTHEHDFTKGERCSICGERVYPP